MNRVLIQPLCILLLVVMLGACAPAPVAAPADGPSPSPAATPATGGEAEQPIHLKLGMFNYASFAPLYFAYKEGYFADQGLDVELVTFASVNEPIPALATGKIDVLGFSLSSSILNAIAQGINMKFVADKGFLDPNATCITDAWVASNQALAAGLSAPATLKGRKVSISQGGLAVEYTFQQLLDQGGLTMADIHSDYINDNAARVEALRTGAIDVVSMGEPWITVAESSGAGKVWKRFADLTPNLSLGLIVYGPTILEKNHEAGVRFMVAYLRGVRQFNEGKTDRNVQLIAEFTKLKPEDLKSMCWNSFSPDGSSNTNAMLAYQRWAVEKGYQDKALELSQFWTDDFIKEAAARLGK